MLKAWVLVLMVALLPLRGWAAVAMSVDVASASFASVPHVVVHEGADSHPGHGVPHGGGDLVATCHDAVAEDSQSHASVHAHDGAGHAGHAGHASHLCAVCDFCHATLALATEALSLRLPAPADAPAVCTPRDTGRLMAGSLERPPRA